MLKSQQAGKLLTFTARSFSIVNSTEGLTVAWRWLPARHSQEAFPVKYTGIHVIMRSDVKGGRHVHVNVMGLQAGGQLKFCGPSSPVGPSSSRCACCSLHQGLHIKTLIHKQFLDLSATLSPFNGHLMHRPVLDTYLPSTFSMRSWAHSAFLPVWDSA